MNGKKVSLIALVIAAAGLCSGTALADRWHGGHHDHVRFGVYIGGPGYWYPPPYYYYPRYYYPPVMAVPTAPPTYIEQNSAPEQSDSNYWYYCAASKTYYPYVKDCPSGWERVSPQPPAP
jgi:hypothetical protein